MRDRNLYRDVLRLDKIAKSSVEDFTSQGTRIVVDAHSIDALTRTRPDPFVEQSAFFRTHLNNPLPADLRRTLRVDLIRLVNTPEAQAHANSPAFATGSFRSQGWGVRATLDHFLPLICADRDPALIDLVTEYVERVVIQANVRGFRQARQSAVSTDIWARMQPLTSSAKARTPSRDLLDVALRVREGLTPREVPELFSRLVLSLVGFTGVALEHTLVMSMRTDADGRTFLQDHPAEHLVNECQRLAPTAWKLIRHAEVVGNPEQLQGVALMTATVQRSARHWPNPTQFDPSRWADRESLPLSEAFFPFGKHQMVCPARQFAMTFLTASIDTLRDDYRVSVGRSRGLPRAHILFSPAPQAINLARSQEK